MRFLRRRMYNRYIHTYRGDLLFTFTATHQRLCIVARLLWKRSYSHSAYSRPEQVHIVHSDTYIDGSHTLRARGRWRLLMQWLADEVIEFSNIYRTF